MKIMFVCHGNICRSPMAEFVFKNMLINEGISGVEVNSCATSREEIGNDIHPGTKNKLYEKSIPFEKREAYRLTRAIYDSCDLVLAMDEENLWGISRIVPEYKKDGKVSLLMEYAGESRNIADPWYTGNFDETYNDVVKGCAGLLEYVKKNLKKQEKSSDK